MADKNIGALWKRTNEKGEFFTGVLENEDGTKQKIVVFKNGYKNKDTQPDYMILKARETQDCYSFNGMTTKEDIPYDPVDDLPF